MAFITNYFEEFNFESGGERAFYEFVKKFNNQNTKSLKNIDGDV